MPFLLSTAACGIALSSLFVKRELPTQVLLLVSMPILFVSGFVWPLALIPDVLVQLSQVIPAVPAILGMLELNQMGADWVTVLPQWLQMWVLFALFLLLAYIGVKRRLPSDLA